MVKFAMFVFSLCVATLLVKNFVFKGDSNDQEKTEESEEE